jgi:serine/threonine protein phosphatase PrpC
VTNLAIPGSPIVQYLAVFDGHGGSGCSMFLQEQFHLILSSRVSFKEQRYQEALEEAFIEAERLFFEQGDDNSGSCAAVCLVTEHKLFVANLGDCKVVVSLKGLPMLVTRDHKASEPLERKRIEEAGGFVVRDRVFGLLAVSRSIGDKEYKSKEMKGAVVCDPEITEIELSSGCELVILGSDGLWDFVPPKYSINYVRRGLLDESLTIADTASGLVRSAIAKGSKDDTTAIVGLIRKLIRSAPTSPQMSGSSVSELNAFERILGFSVKSEIAIPFADEKKESWLKSLANPEEEQIGAELDFEEDESVNVSEAQPIPKEKPKKTPERIPSWLRSQDDHGFDF